MIPFEPFTLHTPRLTLRFLRQADGPALFAMFSHPEVARYMSEPAWTAPSQADQYLISAQEGYRTGEVLQLGIERQADQALVGVADLFHLHPTSRRGEIGYALGRPYWGKGYMHEALQALVRYAFETLDLNRLEADIDPRNSASAKSLERLGFRKEGHMPERWIVGDEVSDTDWYGLLRGEWRKRER